jgi:hypothetical protein
MLSCLFLVNNVIDFDFTNSIGLAFGGMGIIIYVPLALSGISSGSLVGVSVDEGSIVHVADGVIVG